MLPVELQHTCGRLPHSQSWPRPQAVAPRHCHSSARHLAEACQPAICSSRVCREHRTARRRRVSCQAQDTEKEGSTATEERPAESSHASEAEAQAERNRIADTIAGLDALLGIEEVKEEVEKSQPAKAKASDTDSTVEVTENVLRRLAEAEVRKDDKKSAQDYEKAVEQAYNKLKDVYAAANKVRNSTSGSSNPAEVLTKEMEKLMETLEPGTKKDVAVIKDKVMGSQVFWVTETRPDLGRSPGSYLIRGNLRCPQQEAFAKVTKGVKDLFGDKYAVFLVPDPEKAELADGQSSSREQVAFRIVPEKYAVPGPNPTWQIVVAVLLFIFAAGTSFQIGLAANVSTLPQEIVRLLQTSDALDAETIPLELQNFDFVPYLLSAVPIAGPIMGVQLVHEVGHRVAARLKGVKLGVPLFVPNGQIGLYGAVTQFKSLVATRAAMLDIAIAGPVAGGAVSAALFLIGLSMSGGAKDTLLPIPSALLSDSLLLGSITKAVLAPSGSMQSVFVHPFVIGGWCGLVATALNCLPVGALDGGRIMQAAFGRQSLSISSIFVYVALVTGLLGNTLSIPFALYVFIVQRDVADNIQDTVTTPDGVRKGATLSLILLSLLILLPLATGGDPTNPPSISL